MLYRLGAMGVTKGSEISIKQQCLLNGPSIVEINGQYLSIRQSDARLIALEDISMSETFCILGNPNVGKTSLFNALTGSYEYVGNWR